MRGFAGLILAGLVASQVSAQEPGLQASPILTLDQGRLFQSSSFGQRVQDDLDRDSAALQAENRQIEQALVEEERRLTDERAAMDPAEFRDLAEDFDARVTEIRAAQKAKADALLARFDSERVRFFDLAFPVLLDLVRETGAVAILNDSAVIFSVRNIDITDQAIARVDAVIGAAVLDPTGPAPAPRPGPDQSTSPQSGNE